MDKNKKELLDRVKSRFTAMLDYYEPEYRRGQEDFDFLMGEQWEDAEIEVRKSDSRPFLKRNLMMPFSDQVVNAARETRPSIRVSPVDDKGDVDTAEVFKGMIRNIERQSKASIAYDTAVQNSVATGYGWLRVNTAYVSATSFNQEVKIEAVPDWRSCMIDPKSELPDGSDAEDGVVYTDIDKDDFKIQYPDADLVDFEEAEEEGWTQDDKVRLVEYFYKDYEDTKIHECFMRDGTTKVLTGAQLKNEHDVVTILRDRDTKVHKVKWCKASGAEILEETEWLGDYIPLVPVYGKLVWRDGRKQSYSLIHQAKDSQRLLNVVITTIAEIVGSQPKNQPWVGASGQFDADSGWEDCNSQNYAYLQYKPVMAEDESGQSYPVPPPQKAQPLQVSPTLFQQEATATQSINASLGMFDENRGNESNAISGVAIRSRQLRGDKATFHFIDNLASSIRHTGVIAVDIVPKVYNQAQVARIVGEDGKEKTVNIDPQAVTDKTKGIYNIHAGKYDVDVDIGPSYANQQQEFVDIMKELIRVQPELANVTGDKLIESIGGPYADIIADRIRALNPLLLTDDPVGEQIKVLEQKLAQSEDKVMTLHAALEDKQKNEEFENELKLGELHDKKANTQIKLMDTMSKIDERSNEGVTDERVADLAEAIMEVNQKVDMMSQPVIQASGQPEEGFIAE